jgi:signal transduction histidine kinase
MCAGCRAPTLGQVLARLRSPSSRIADWTLAAGLCAYAESDVWLRHGVVPGPKAVGALGLAAMTVPLGLRRRWPLAVACVSMAALAAEGLAAGGAPEGGAVFLPVLVVLYTVAAYESLWRALIGAGVAFAAVVVQSVQDPKLVGFGDVVLVDGFFFGLIGGAVWLAGRYVRRRRRLEGTLETRTRLLERDREQHAVVIAAERGRIARELHDVIAHTVSVMGIQAAAAAQVLDHDPQRARAPLDCIQTTARDAVKELERLLGVLREGPQSAELAPQPDLGGLEELIEHARDSDVPVELSIEGNRRTLPAGIELAAYRIAQESLTNIRKHAGPARARVTVRYGPTCLDVLVEDSGRGSTGATSTGHGLVGMRERAALYGGTLEAGPRPGGGFRVRARLPVEARGR